MSKINTMKIRLLFIVTLLAGIVSACGEKDIAVFEGRNQIYFEKFYMNALYPGTKEADTTRTSFFFFPDIMTPPLLQLFSSFLTRTASGFWDQQTHSTNLRSGS